MKMKKQVILISFMLLILLALAACSCEHEWRSAVCDAPKTCSACGEKEGVPLGHTWNDATCTIPKTCSACRVTEGEPLGHTWDDATCTIPKTCSVCGEKEGAPLGHAWNDATCTLPQTCSVCQATEGESLGHVWNDATCTVPKNCSICGKTEGIKLNHSYGAWQIKTEATVLQDGRKTRYCNSCGKEESEAYNLSSFVNNNRFIFTPQEYRKLFFDNFINLGYSKFGGAQVRTKDNQVMVSIVDNKYNNVGNIGFVSDSDEWKMASSENEKDFEGIVMIISANEEFVAKAMLCLIMSCDPTVNKNVAKEVAKCVLEEPFEFGGIKYSFTVSGNYFMMTAVVNG